jgi:hypoxanthine-DNA glycosylase
MTETHPYEPFVPPNATILILGSFPGLHQTRRLNDFEEWFYSAKRNKFWKIIETVYSTQLKTVDEKKRLFTDKGIAITDIILKAKRMQESNLDQHLYDIEYNTEAIEKIIADPNIKKVFFTSQFVHKHFKKLFPNYEKAECLPSPSPRYARISLDNKIQVYRQKLPQNDN